VLRGLSHRFRSEPHLGGKHRAAVDVRACVLSQVLATARAENRVASSERVRGEFRHAEAEAAGQALGDDVIRAIDKEQGALVRGQDLASCTVHVVQTTVDDSTVSVSAMGSEHLEHFTCM
jgi:hypothetical protein